MTDATYEGIAIVGMAGRFPGAGNVDELWANLVAGRETVSSFNDDELAAAGLDPATLRRRGQYVAARGVLADVDCFDAALFGINPIEATVIDPQQRLFLETCWASLEHAGYAPNQSEEVVGVFAGASFNTYYLHALHPRPALRELIGNDLVMFGNEKDYLTTRVAYKLGLKGPALNVSTACSTSLVAVCQACQSLLLHQCDLALAGGVSVTVPQTRGYFHDEGNIGSADGHTRTFDAHATGTVFGNGVGVVVLKRLEDAVRDGDRVYAVIKGAALNNDGAHRVSFGAPGVEGQSEAIAMAHALAGIAPGSISYVEAHGTATPLGDPIEIAALTKAFRLGTSARQFCAIGSVKTNVGHLDVAAGVTGLIKTALSIDREQLPASLHFEEANPRLDLTKSPFYVNSRLRPWPRTAGAPRRAGVSSFGTGGTNAHVVVEEAPELPPSDPGRPWQLLTLSARTEAALERATVNLAAHLRAVATDADADRGARSLADVAFTLHTGRSTFPHRRSVICRDATDGAQALEGKPPRVITRRHDTALPVVFMFPGQGAQYPGMGSELYCAEPVFRSEVDRCCEILRPLLDVDLRPLMISENGPLPDADAELRQTRLTQPALFVTEYALAALWRSWGVEPSAMIGHSVGEYVAGCLAGVFSLEDALTLVARRGALVQSQPPGAMLAVRLSESQVSPLLTGQLAIAAINAPSLCVVSGPVDAIADLEAQLVSQDVIVRHLHTSHAFHSPMMDPVVAPFTDLVRNVRLSKPQIPYISNVTAGWITAEEATSPEYWGSHVRAAVRFADGVSALMTDLSRVLLEVGPGTTLATLARQHPSRSPQQLVLSTIAREGDERRTALEALGTMWASGVQVNWRHFHAHERRHKVALPTYPFERTRCWPTDAVEQASPTGSTAPAGEPMPAAPACHPRTVAAIEIESPAAPVCDVDEANATATAIGMPEPPRKDRLIARLRSLLQQMSGSSLEAVAPEMPFLEIGLDSLLLTQVSTKLQREFGVRVTFRQLMEGLSSMEALASHLDAALPPEPVTVPAPRVAASSTELKLGSAKAPSTADSAGQSLPLQALERLLINQQQLTTEILSLVRLHDRPAPAQTEQVSIPAPRTEALPAVAPGTFGPFRGIETTSAGLSGPQQVFLDDFIARYTARTGRSKRHTQTHRRHLADPRTMAGFRPYWKEMVYPLVIERSWGARVRDVDGNDYVDFTMGFGTNLLGHSPSFVTDALEAQLRRGIEVGPQTPMAGEVARLMCELTGMERCGFCNTGSEAVLAAIRVSRTVTGRPLIVYFTGDYHGIFDEVLQRGIGRPDAQELMPSAPGIPAASPENVLILEYDRPESIEIIRARGSEIAAVIVEPVQSRHPDAQPRQFLRQLREVTRETGSALVFDEIITGFRVHPAGVRGLFGIDADIATYGKIIGGGMPIGAICGSARFLDALDGGFWQYGDASIPEAGVTFFAGTYVRHPLAIAGAHAVLTHLQHAGPSLQQRLNERMGVVAGELNDFLRAEGAPLHIEHFGSMFWVRIDPKLKFANLLFFLLRDKGIHIFEGRLFFLSTAHSDADVQALVEAFKASVREMQQAAFLPSAIEGPAKAGHYVANPAGSTVAAPSSSSTIVAAPGFSSAPAQAPPVPVPAPRTNLHTREMKFGAYFFGSYPAAYSSDKYQLLIDAARFADTHDFSAIWIPERHFHTVGGFSPNPSVVAAALARETRRIHIRAGSVVLPLHNPIRVAEEWAVVDNLSSGRVGMSVASGWHPNDFVFAPDAYDRRRELCTDGIRIIRALWSGQAIPVRGGTGETLDVRLHPMPAQRELPMWLTCVQAASYEKAGELGCGVLAMLANQRIEEVAEKIALYRQTLAAHGHDPASGNVTLLVHTFVGATRDAAVARARGPMREYLRSYLDNSQKRHEATGSGEAISQDDLEYLLDRSFDDYVAGKALIGSPESCAPVVDRLREIGVDEIGCFLDFGVDADAVRAGLPHLDALRRLCNGVALLPAEVSVKPDSSRPIAVATATDRTIPLTEAQQGLYLLSRLAPHANRAYTERTTLRLRGDLRLDVVSDSLQTLVDRHESLRTSIDTNGETQTVHAHARIDVALTELSNVSEEFREQALADTYADIEAVDLDLTKAPMMAAHVVRMAPDHHLLVLTFHHVLGNGPSIAVLFDELCEIYEARCAGRPPRLENAMQLSDFVSWQQTHVHDAAVEQDRVFWRAQFADGVPLLDLPADHPRPAAMTYRGRRQSIVIEPALTETLRVTSRRLRASLFTTLFAGFNVWLHRLSGQHDIVVGVPFESPVRGVPGGDHLFANTTSMVPLRSRLDAQSFAELVAATRSLVLDANEHQTYFVGRLVRDLQIRPDLSRTPLFAASFNYEANPFARTLRGLEVTLLLEGVPFSNPHDASKFELTVNVVDTGDRLVIDCDYNADLFDQPTMERWLGHLGTLLESITANPEEGIDRLQLLTATERARLVRPSPVPLPVAADAADTLHDWFETQAEASPDAVAVIDGRRSLTYGELNRRANQVAHHLRALGVDRNVLVGLYLERSIDLIVGLIGILKAGGAYLPIDPAYPRDRVAFMLDDGRAPVLVTDSRVSRTVDVHTTRMVRLDADRAMLDAQPVTNPNSGATGDDLAYVIYTSGSTGQPKGTLVTHHNVVRLMRSTEPWFGFNASDVWTLFHSHAFDFSVWELWGALCYGGRAVVVPYETSRSPEDFHRLVRDEGVTVLNQTPSAFGQFIDADARTGSRRPLALRHVIFGGEALDMRMLAPWFERHGDRSPRLINMYGITETTVHVTYRPLTAADVTRGSVIGIPIPDLQLYVLDRHQEPVPVGVAGEIHVGGAGVARGYLRRDQLTRERFVPDAFSGVEGAVRYRSGDLARRLANGDLEYLGRIDDQVKIRGFRIELGEIEAVLNGHQAIRESVVVARKDNPGERRLVAYLLPESSSTGLAPVETLRAFVERSLPPYMVPSAFVEVAAWPLTTHGKLDRAALPAPPDVRPALKSAFVEARTRAEERLAAIWCELLGMQTVGAQDDFFHLGGDSLLAMRLARRVHDELGVRLSPGALFEHTVLADLARHIEAAPVQLHTASREALTTAPIPDTLEPLSEKVLFQMASGENAGTPFVWVHGVGGEIYSFVNVARHLSAHRRILGFAADWSRLSPDRVPSVELIAAHYVRELRQQQPSGPYHLGGFCSGAMIALEIARQLESAGEQVGTIAAVDYSILDTPRAPSWGAALARFARNLPLWLRDDAMPSSWRNLMIRFISFMRRRVAGVTRREMDLRDALGAPNFPDHQLPMLRTHLDALRQYVPKPVDVRITLVQSRTAPLFGPWATGFDETWLTLARGGVDTCEVPGSHMTMFSDPFAVELASRLNEAIEKAEKRMAWARAS